MGNTGTIYQDKYSISLKAVIRIPLFLKCMLAGFFLLVLSFAVFILSLFDGDSSGSMILPVCGLSALLFLAGRYVSWNFSGKETITVTTRSIRYFRDYGLVKTPPRVITFHHFATSIEAMRQENNTELGRMHFYDRVAATMQLKPIFATGIHLPLEQLKEFEEKIHRLFMTDEQDTGRWLPYSLN